MVWDGSRSARALQTVERRLSRAIEDSVCAGAARSLAGRVEALVCHSYRWLTAEPDPALIVIDLWETRTLWRFLWLLERPVNSLERVWATSRLPSVATTVASVLSRSRTGQLLAALLEPPAPTDAENEGE